MFGIKLLFFFGIVVLANANAPDDDYRSRFDYAVDRAEYLLQIPSGKTRTNLILGLTEVASSTYANLGNPDDVTYYQWVNQVESDIVNNDEAYPTDTDKFNAVAIAIEKFQWDHRTIYDRIWFYNISEWSTVIDVVSMAAEYHFQSSLDIIRTDSEGSSELFDWMRTLPGSDSSTEDFIQEILKPIMTQQPEVSQDEILAQVYEALNFDYFENHPEKKKNFYLSNNPEFGGTFEQFMDVGKIYFQKKNYENLLNGGISDSIFYLKLSSYFSNSSLPASDRIRISNFRNAIRQYWNDTSSTPEYKLQKVSWHFCDFTDYAWVSYRTLGALQFDDFGTFYDLIILSAYFNHLPTTVVPLPVITTTQPPPVPCYECCVAPDPENP